MKDMSKEKPPYQDRDWLYEQYVVQKKTSTQIARELGVGNTVIYHWLKINNLLRTKSEALTLRHERNQKLYKNKEWLHNQYVVRKKCAREVAKECDASDAVIYSWLHKFGIEVRTISEASFVRFGIKPYHNYGWLYDQYVTKRKNSYQIAREINVTHSVIYKNLKKFGIEIRTKSKASILRHGHEKYHKYGWLQEQYCTRERSLTDISIEIGSSISTVSRILERFGIKKRSQSESCMLRDTSGENNPAWKGGISFEPYCHKFNDKIKERIRNNQGRSCFLCGKGEIKNGERLSVHHIDADKMQGCDGKKWKLIALCKFCHRSIHNSKESEFELLSSV